MPSEGEVVEYSKKIYKFIQVSYQHLVINVLYWFIKDAWYVWEAAQKVWKYFGTEKPADEGSSCVIS